MTKFQSLNFNNTMHPQQFTLFQDPEPSLHAALAKIKAGKLAPPNLTAFVAQLCSMMDELPAGSLILAAVPSDDCATEAVCNAVRDFQRQRSVIDGGRRETAVVTLPYSINRDYERQMPDVYARKDVSKLGYRHEPRLQLDAPLSYKPEPFQKVSGLISVRGADYFIVKNSHYLGAIHGNVNETINRLRFFVEIAHATGRTHVMLINPVTLNTWLQSFEIAGAASHCWLKPYSIADDESFREFKSVVKSHEVLIPREKDFYLLNFAAQIYDAVYGCPYRFRKWTIATLVGALGRKATEVSWNDFVKHAPTASDREHAILEFTSVRDGGEPITSLLPLSWQKGKTVDGAKENRKRPKPGQRKLGRDDAGHNTAA